MTHPRTKTDPINDARNDVGSTLHAGIAPPVWRLPESVTLGHVSLQIADLAKSLDYYATVLGLRVLEQSSVDALLGTTDGATPLVHLVERRGAAPIPRQGRLGLYHFALLMPDRAALGSFVEHLAAIGAVAGSSDHLVSEALYLRDPDGLGIEVYADRPRSLWRVVNRQIEMASNPLDLADLVRAANGAQWNGMPSGTIMGHVHLQVADLDRASTFYHEALGFDRMVWSYPGALFLAAGGYHHHLGLNTWAGANAPRPTDEDARLLEWRLVLPTAADVRSVAERLAAAGNAISSDGEDCIATDPWGTAVRVLARS